MREGSVVPDIAVDCRLLCRICNMSSYEQLHRQCRTLENLLDTKLNSYSQLVSTFSKGGDDVEANGSAERWKDLELEVDDLLEKVCTWLYTEWLTNSSQLEENNEKLEELSSNPETLSQSMLRAIQRHRELFQDSAREVKRTKVRLDPNHTAMNRMFVQASVKNAMDQANLLSGVRNDIEYEFTTQTHSAGILIICHSAYRSTAADSLLAERGRIDSSHHMTDTIIE